jgi:MFS family permease
VWSIGNGLASTTLVIYLANELNVPRVGLGISLILAAPQIIGLLRLGAPAMIGRLAGRKGFCISTFVLSALLLLALPWLAAPGRLPSANQSLAALVSLWAGFHLLQYLGMVALWSWMADLTPQHARGRFFGWRERWLVIGQAAGAVVAGVFSWGFPFSHPDSPKWVALAIPAAVGAIYMLASVVPLMRMPSATVRREAEPPIVWRAMLAPLGDARFARLLLFGCWFSFFNGVTQSAQYFFPIQVLGISLFLSLTLQTGMRLGQSAVSPSLGRLADRFGNRPVMIVCQLLVALGLLCFLFATPAHWGWLIVAWSLWIAYAGLNVGLPNLMLKLSPHRANTPYIAAFYAITGLCYAASTIVGGLLVDHFRNVTISLFGTGISLDFFGWIFLFGWAARSVGAVLLWLVVEPRETEPQHRWADIR